MESIKYTNQVKLDLTGEIEEISDFPFYFVIVTNTTKGTVCISKYKDMNERMGTKDVISLSPNETGYIGVAIDTINHFYICGNGSVEIIPKDCEKACVMLCDRMNSQSNSYNQNLLINPDFRINQYRTSGAINAAGYFIDRWQLVSGEVTINSDKTLALNGTIKQVLENSPGVNVIASSSAGSANYDDSTKTFSITASGETISWAKLEQGNRKTAFSSPDTSIELLKCQRYAVEFNADQLAYSNVGDGIGRTNSTEAVILLPLSVPLRAYPTLKMSGSWVLTSNSDSSSDITVTGQRNNVWNNNTFNRMLLIVSGENIVPGRYYQLRASNDKSASLFLDAEIH